MSVWMVPFEIVPILAMAMAIMFIPLLSDGPPGASSP